MKKFFSAGNTRVFKSPHFWLILGILTFLIFIYQFWPWREWQFSHGTWHWLGWLSSLDNLLIIEFSRRLVGSLFLIPIIYAAIVFQWRGAAVATLLSLMGILPIVLNLWQSLDAWLINLSLLLLPVCLVLVINIEIELRRKNQEYYSNLEKERRIYLSKTLEAQENERHRLAQELHDESIQTLLATASHAEALEATDDNNIAEIKQEAGWIKETIRSTVEELRRLSLDLRPSVLDNLGLVAALRWLADQAGKQHDIKVRVIIRGSANDLPAQVEVSVFRIVQEALNNIRRHASANEASILLHFDPAAIKLSIQDNGRGFKVPPNLTGYADSGRLGLIGIQQRTRTLGGTFDIFSESGEGTSLSIEIPLTPAG